MDIRPGLSPTPPEPDANLIEAAQQFLPAAEVIEPLAGRDSVVRVRQGDEWWKVRRWPEPTPRSRVEFIHQVLGELANEPPAVAPRLHPATAGGTVVVHQGRLYDAQSWLPGSPVADGPEVQTHPMRWAPLPVVASDEEVVATIRAVALAHARTEQLARPSPAGPPLAQLVAAVGQAWKAQRDVLRPLATMTPAVRRWLGTGERALPAAEAAVAAADEAAGQVICHFGLWPAHVILPAPDDDPATNTAGLIGWEHCNTGSPLIDLVQAVSRFRGWSAAGAELAIAAYTEVRPLRPEERRLLPAVAALDLVATSGQMLIYAYGGRPGGTRPPTALREAARSLLDSLDVATNALAAQDRPKRPAGDRGRRPGGGARGDRSAQKSRKPRGPKKRR